MSQTPSKIKCSTLLFNTLFSYHKHPITLIIYPLIININQSIYPIINKLIQLNPLNQTHFISISPHSPQSKAKANKPWEYVLSQLFSISSPKIKKLSRKQSTNIIVDCVKLGLKFVLQACMEMVNKEEFEEKGGGYKQEKSWVFLLKSSHLTWGRRSSPLQWERGEGSSKGGFVFIKRGRVFVLFFYFFF